MSVNISEFNPFLISLQTLFSFVRDVSYGVMTQELPVYIYIYINSLYVNLLHICVCIYIYIYIYIYINSWYVNLRLTRFGLETPVCT
jgi:hypothetical protein